MSGIQLGTNGAMSSVGSVTIKDITAPSAPGATNGVLYKRAGTGLYYKSESSETEYDLTTPQVINGSIIAQASSDATSTTVSGTNVLKLTLTTPSLVAGVYKLTYQFETNGNVVPDTTRCIVQVTFDGVTVSESGSAQHNTGGSLFELRSGFAYRTLTAGVKTCTIHFRTEVPNGLRDAQIRNARLELTRFS